MKVNLSWYDWIVVNTSSGKDSQATLLLEWCSDYRPSQEDPLRLFYPRGDNRFA